MKYQLTEVTPPWYSVIKLREGEKGAFHEVAIHRDYSVIYGPAVDPEPLAPGGFKRRIFNDLVAPKFGISNIPQKLSDWSDADMQNVANACEFPLDELKEVIAIPLVPKEVSNVPILLNLAVAKS